MQEIDPKAKLRARRRAGPKRQSPSDGRQAAIWLALSGRARRTWTCRDIAQETEIPIRTIQAYVAALVKAGTLARVTPIGHTQAGAVAATYRAKRALGPIPPVVRGYGGDRIADDPN